MIFVKSKELSGDSARLRSVSGELGRLFANDLDEDAVGEFAFQDVDDAVFDEAFENLAGWAGGGGR
jgi:hypothetical protein